MSKKDQLDEKEVTKTILEVYEGLKYLGEKNIIHRDLKAPNILMNDGQIKIADFGFAKKTRYLLTYSDRVLGISTSEVLST